MTDEIEEDLGRAWNEWKIENKYLCNLDELSFKSGFRRGYESAKWNQECADIADEINYAKIKELEAKVATYEAMLKAKDDDYVKATKQIGQLEYALHKGIAR